MESLELNFWKKKKIFITGHSGFKGSWLSRILIDLGAEVSGLSLPLGKTNTLFINAIQDDCYKNFFGDINDSSLLEESLKEIKPDIIFHLAAQPLVYESYQDPIKTFETNIIGTSKVMLAALKVKSIKSLINITSDKCYKNSGNISQSFKEDDPMGGDDPYSASKACAEIVSDSIKYSFFKDSSIGIANGRAGNVIGGGDYSDNRLLPDVVKSINSGTPLPIRSPLAVRPWQHVLEPLFGYIELAERIYHDKGNYEGGWNFGPEIEDCLRVEQILEIVKKFEPRFVYELSENNEFQESQYLKLDINKAKNNLKWGPKWSAETAISKTLEFNSFLNNSMDEKEILKKQINEYLSS